MLKELQTLCQIPLTAGKQSQNAAGKSVCAKTIYTPEGKLWCGKSAELSARAEMLATRDARSLLALDSTFSAAAAG